MMIRKNGDSDTIRYFFSMLHDIPSMLSKEETEKVRETLSGVRRFAVFSGTTGAPERSEITKEKRLNIQNGLYRFFDRKLLYFEWSDEFLYCILDWGDSSARLRQLLKQAMKENPDIRHISVGFFCTSMDDIVREHRFVTDMMDYGILTNRPLFFAEELPAPHYDLSCRVAKGRLEDSYMQAVVGREFSVAYHALSQIVMQELDEDIRSVRRLKHRLLARVENALQIMGIAVDDPNETSHCRELFRDAATQDAIQGMLCSIEQIYRELDTIAKNETDTETGKTEEILSFIETNFSEPALDTTMVSDACNVSKSYVGRVVKERGGSSFVDYVNALRVGASKEYLKNTESSIDEIFTKVGYTNRWTYLRAFKRFVGMTPSEYRKYSVVLR